MAFKQTYLTIVSQFGGLRLAFPEVPIKREDFAQMTQDVLKQMPKKEKTRPLKWRTCPLKNETHLFTVTVIIPEIKCSPCCLSVTCPLSKHAHDDNCLVFQKLRAHVARVDCYQVAISCSC